MIRIKIIWLNSLQLQTKWRILLTMFTFILMNPSVFSQTRCKAGNTWVNDTIGEHFILINPYIDDPWPCGEEYAISIEDDRFFFCKNSSTLYSLANPYVASKTNENDFNNEAFRQKISKRINSVRVVEATRGNGKQLGLLLEDMLTHYPENTKEITLNGEKQFAFNPENILYELLLTTQQQNDEIARLNLRLDQMEKQLGKNNNANSIKNSYVKIMVNPIRSNELELEYSISENVDNASIVLSTLNGKTLKTIPFNKRRVGVERLYIDLSKGLYLCTLITDGIVLQSEKFVVQ